MPVGRRGDKWQGLLPSFPAGVASQSAWSATVRPRMLGLDKWDLRSYPTGLFLRSVLLCFFFLWVLCSRPLYYRLFVPRSSFGFFWFIHFCHFSCESCLLPLQVFSAVYLNCAFNSSMHFFLTLFVSPPLLLFLLLTIQKYLKRR